MTKTLEKIPKFTRFEQHFEIILDHLKSIDHSSLDKILSFLKSEKADFKKYKKNQAKSQQTIPTEECYSQKFLDELGLLSLFLKSIKSEFKSLYKLIKAFFKKRIDMADNLVRSYLDYFSTFYSDLKLRTRNFSDSEGLELNFYMVNSYNIREMNVSINFKMYRLPKN